MSPRGLALVTLLALLLAPVASAGWAQEGGNAQRTGTVSAPLPTSDVALVWNATGQYASALVLPDGSVAGIGDPVTVWEKDGTQRWSTRTVGPQSQVFVARGAALLSNGSIVAAGSLPFGAPAIVAYDPASGKQWLFDRDVTGKCDSLDDTGIAVAADDSFYVGCGPGVLAYAKDGARKWSYAGDVERVTLDATRVYAQADDVVLPNGTKYEEALIALSQADGSLAWATRLDDGGNDPLVAQDLVVLVDDGRVRGFAASDGAPRWATIVPRPYGLALAPNGTIASASSSAISWLSPSDGRTLGASRTVDGTGLLVGATVHLRIYGANVVAVDDKGTTLWRVDGTARNFQIEPAIGDDGTLYLPEEGQMRAYRGAGGVAAPAPTGPSNASPAAPAPDASAEPAKESPAPGALALAAALAVAALAWRRRSG